MSCYVSTDVSKFLPLCSAPAIQISGCRALAQLCPKLDADIVRPVLPLVFSSLDALLKAATEETLHLVLETLSVAVKAGKQLRFLG